MREKFRRFMAGRYGIDLFGRFLLYFSVIMLLVSYITRLNVIYYIAFAVLVYEYFRMFSRSIYKRSAENTKYIYYKEKVVRSCKEFGKAVKSLFSGKKVTSFCNPDFKIYKCPKCRQKLRVPRGKGKIQISCKRCGNSFIKRT